MTAIDWTKPVETDEENPRPVTILFDKDGRPDAARIDNNASSPSLNLFALQHVGSTAYATRGMYSIPLRNVAPKTVKREAWINVYKIKECMSNGSWYTYEVADMYDTKEEALKARISYTVATIHIEWEEPEEEKK